MFAMLMSLIKITLRNFCKRTKIFNIVIMRCVEDYEPSYKGLKLEIERRYVSWKMIGEILLGMRRIATLVAFHLQVMKRMIGN